MVYSDDRLAYLNGAALRLFGAERQEQLLGRPFLDLVHRSRHDEVAGRMRLSQREGRGSSLTEFQYLRVDGSVVDVEAVSTPIIFEGRPAGQVLIRDITERRRAEEQVRATNDMRRLIIDNIPQFIFWKDKDSVYLGCNQNFADGGGACASRRDRRQDGPRPALEAGGSRELPDHGPRGDAGGHAPAAHPGDAAAGGRPREVAGDQQDSPARRPGPRHGHPGDVPGRDRAQARGGADPRAERRAVPGLRRHDRGLVARPGLP